MQALVGFGGGMRVVVVGAGLGGLCVASGLHEAGMDVEVLEARDGIGDSGQGYRINVNAAGHEALRECLSAGRFDAYERTLHRQRDPGVYLYSAAWELIARHEAPKAPGAIDRGTLRWLVAEGLAGRIHFGRRVTSVAEISGADLIIAADGVGSALRRERLPLAEPSAMGWSAIFGRTPLADRSRMAPEVLHSRFCGLVDGTAVLALCAYDPPASTSTRPYVMWVLMGPTGDLPAPGTSPDELLRFAEDRTADWDSRAGAVLREATVADTFLTPLRALAEIPEIPASDGIPVAFLGDAVHAMSPAGGEGANTAFGDAALLLSHLRAADTVADAVTGYHAEMRVTAGEALRRSASYAAVSRA